MTYGTCFSYPADVPPGIGNRPAAQPTPPGLRRMPTTSSCFKYPGDMHPCFSYTADTPAQYGYLHCFSYPAEVPPGARTCDASQFGYLSCFSY